MRMHAGRLPKLNLNPNIHPPDKTQKTPTPRGSSARQLVQLESHIRVVHQIDHARRTSERNQQRN